MPTECLLVRSCLYNPMLAQRDQAADHLISLFMGNDPDNSRMTGKPHLTACFSDWSRHAASDCGIWQSRPLRIKWQDWIAPGGRINSSSGMAASGSIMLHSVAAFNCNKQAAQNWKRSCRKPRFRDLRSSFQPCSRQRSALA